MRFAAGSTERSAVRETVQSLGEVGSLGEAGSLLPRSLAARVPRRLAHAGVAALLVTVTVVLVTQVTVGVTAVTNSVASLLAGPIRVPPQKCSVGSNVLPPRRALVLFDDRGGYAPYATQAA